MRRRADAGHLTLEQHLALAADGWDPVTGEPFDSLDDVRDAWKANRDALMARCEPGTRPFAFWALEGPPELIVPDASEPIDAKAWGIDPANGRPAREYPETPEHARRARLDDYARERRLQQRRREWLEAPMH